MRTDQKFPIVGIGASAGGIEALQGFFGGLPADPGAAFVVITHLNPTHESFLHEILSRFTSLPVSVAAEGIRLTPNHVYVMPPDVLLGIEDGTLRIKQRPSRRLQEIKPVDIFLSALAKDRGECAVSVILSGADGDGTLGTKAVKEAGGLTLAQVRDGHGPAYPDMPATAIAAGVVDLALPVEQMGAKIVEFSQGFLASDTSMSEAPDGEHSSEKAREELYTLLRNQTGHDFSGYKTKTFLRRIQRRMHIGQLDNVEAYIEWLRRDPKEVQALFRDLLISVTDFFRDGEAFEKLKELVIPKLFEERGAHDTVRVWVPGCATGEEVYSIGILMREHMATLTAVPRVQIFATDIDEKALSVARAARYPEELLQAVTGDRRRFFIPDGGTYVVSNEVRELCIFSTHNLIRDPPFSRMDLISCRNLLIYFGPDVQQQVIPIFHYSLRPGGYLFLGTAENATQCPELFLALDKKYRIFKSREDAPASHPPLLFSTPKAQWPDEWAPRSAAKSGAALRQEVETQVLERLAPPHVVVNQDGEIVYYSAKTGKYLEAPLGSPTRQLLAVTRRGLRLDLRTAVRECIQSSQKSVREHVHVETDDGRVQPVTISVEPVFNGNHDKRLLLIAFLDEGQAITAGEAEASSSGTSESTDRLERELRETRDRLQSQIEEYETALEELKSSNEELVSMNEEMQSTNEELEASREEMSSLNEELHTVNSELTAKVESLDRANSDLQNLFESTQIATVFLDKDLIIRIFTPGLSRFFNILPGDRGRPLSHITSRFPLPDLATDVRRVVDTGERLERVAKDEFGADFLIRLNPYRHSDGVVDGVVISFVELAARTAGSEPSVRTRIGS